MFFFLGSLTILLDILFYRLPISMIGPRFLRQHDETVFLPLYFYLNSQCPFLWEPLLSCYIHAKHIILILRAAFLIMDTYLPYWYTGASVPFPDSVHWLSWLANYMLTQLLMFSVWKSSPGTGKRLRPDQDWTTKDWDRTRTGPQKTETGPGLDHKRPENWKTGDEQRGWLQA